MTNVIIFLSLIWVLPSFAEVTAPIHPGNKGDVPPPRDFITDCTNVCTAFTHKDTPEIRKLFKQNCTSAQEDADSLRSLMNASVRSGSIMAKLGYMCAPRAVAKAAVSLYELVGYAFSSNPLKAEERAQRKKFLEDCGKSKECKRNTARQLTDYRDKNADGSFKVSDAEVDKFAGSMNFRELSRKVQDEFSRLSPTCNSLYNTFNVAVQETMQKSSEYERKREVYQRLNKEAPYCPLVISLEPPYPEIDVEKGKTAKPGELNIEDLNAYQQFLVGYGCMGPAFGDEVMMKQVCPEAGQFLVPLPLGPAGKLIKGMFAGGKLTAKEVSAIIKSLPKDHAVISVLDHGVLTRSVSADGKINYQIMGRRGSVDQLRMDPSGYAISASNDVARELAYADMMSGGKTAMMIDMNHLGLVNYFEKGSEAGDAYLAGGAKKIAEIVGDRGVVYRWGGDEFLVIYNSTDKTVGQKITQEISDGIAKDREIHKIFRTDKITTAQNYKKVMAAENYESLPAKFVDTMTVEEKAFAKNNFKYFKERFEIVEKAKIKHSASIQPSVSTGSAVIDGRSPLEAIELSNKGVAKSKSQYKTCMGLEIKKYLGRDSYLPPEMAAMTNRNLKCLPIAPPTY